MASSCFSKVARFCILASRRPLKPSCYNPTACRFMSSDSSSDSNGELTDSKTEKPKLNLAKPTRKRVRDPQTKNDSSSDEEGIDPHLVTAARSVASEFLGSETKVESDLLQQLRVHAKTTKDQMSGTRPVKSSVDINDMFSGMKIDGSDKGSEAQGTGRSMMDSQRSGISGREQSVVGRMQGGYGRDTSPRDTLKLFDGKRLNLFERSQAQTLETDQKKSTLWDTVQQEEMDKLIDHPPLNAFEEMILWTKQGKMWNFPIDNEQGWHEEANVPFHEHVFLEKHIKDFPKKGPLRNFMELVTVGLSKNPYMSVEQKIENINWFREYFSDKLQIIEDSVEHAKSEVAASS